MITEADISVGDSEACSCADMGKALVGMKVHEISDWQDVLPGGHPVPHHGIAQWLNTLFS